MEDFPTKAGPTAGQAPVRHLYVHIPFCHRICPYCSFHKHTPGGHDLPAFFRAVVEEARRAGERYWIDPLTIYFGGGTPTLPSRTTLAAFFKEFRDAVDVSRVSEFTFEANPRTFDRDKITFLLDQGVTRISLGVQAWDQRTLTTLGRDHSPAEGADAYATLRAAGVPSVNIDLMFSVPGQTLEAWRQSLHFTAGLEPDHVSAYNLNYEEDTEFFSRFTRGEFSTDPEADAVFFDAAVDVLEAAGLAQYEVSNYARPDANHDTTRRAGAGPITSGSAPAPSRPSPVAGGRTSPIPRHTLPS